MERTGIAICLMRESESVLEPVIGALLEISLARLTISSRMPCRKKSRLVGWGCHLGLTLGLQLCLDHLAQVAERVGILVTELARDLVHDAQRADVVTAWPLHRLRSVEPDVRLLEYQRVLREPRIQHGIFDDEDFVRIDRVAAEREIACAVADRKTRLRLEPLALALDERDAGKGNIEHTLRHAADLVEALFGRRFDSGAAQAELHESLRFVLGDKRAHHFLRLRPQSAASHDRSDARAESSGIDRLVK